jgi:hypothetical protein
MEISFAHRTAFPLDRDNILEPKNYRQYSVHAVFGDGNDYGCVYSTGIYEETGGPDFYASDVPRDKAHPLRIMIDYLYYLNVHDKESHECGGIMVVLHELVGKERKIALENHMFQTNMDARVIQLRPLFSETEGSFRTWGRYPPAPQGKDKMAQSIVKKFRRGTFVRHLDGNGDNTKGPGNVEPVHIADAMSNADWAVDWVANLTNHEAMYVRQNHFYFAKVFAKRRNLFHPK